MHPRAPDTRWVLITLALGLSACVHVPEVTRADQHRMECDLLLDEARSAQSAELGGLIAIGSGAAFVFLEALLPDENTVGNDTDARQIAFQATGSLAGIAGGITLLYALAKEPDPKLWSDLGCAVP